MSYCLVQHCCLLTSPYRLKVRPASGLCLWTFSGLYWWRKFHHADSLWAGAERGQGNCTCGFIHQLFCGWNEQRKMILFLKISKNNESALSGVLISSSLLDLMQVWCSNNTPASHWTTFWCFKVVLLTLALNLCALHRSWLLEAGWLQKRLQSGFSSSAGEDCAGGFPVRVQSVPAATRLIYHSEGSLVWISHVSIIFPLDFLFQSRLQRQMDVIMPWMWSQKGIFAPIAQSRPPTSTSATSCVFGRSFVTRTPSVWAKMFETVPCESSTGLRVWRLAVLRSGCSLGWEQFLCAKLPVELLSPFPLLFRPHGCSTCLCTPHLHRLAQNCSEQVGFRVCACYAFTPISNSYH